MFPLTSKPRALPAAVQVDLHKRDGLNDVFVALLINDVDVLPVFYRAAVQSRNAGVPAGPRPDLDGFVLPGFSVC